MPVCRNRWIVQHYLISWIGEQADYCRQRHFGWDRDGVRRGRPGLAGSAPSGLVAVGVPAANGLSRIFGRRCTPRHTLQDLVQWCARWIIFSTSRTVLPERPCDAPAIVAHCFTVWVGSK